MKLEFETEVYESIFANEPAVQVLKTEAIYSPISKILIKELSARALKKKISHNAEDETMIMFRTLDTVEWTVMSKKQFLKKYRKVSNDYKGA